MRIITLFTVLCFPLFLTAQAESKNDSIIYTIALNLDSTIGIQDDAYLESMFDKSKFTEFVMGKENKENPKLLSFNQGIQQSIDKSITQVILKQAKESYFDFVNFTEYENGSYDILFRKFSGEGINYFEFFLLPDGKGNFKIVDYYIYLAGEYMSQTFKRLYLGGVAAIVNENEEEAVAFVKDIYAMKSITNRLNAGKIDKAIEEFNELDEALQNTKVMKLLQLRMYSEKDFDSYLKVMNEYLALFPNDISMHMVNIDKFIVEEKYEQTLATIDTLQLITQDDFLDLFRGNVYMMKGDYDQSLKYYNQLLEAYPYFVEGYDYKLSLLINKERFQEAIDFLDHMIIKLEADKTIIISAVEKEYLDLYKSDLFQAWKDK